MQRLQVGVGAPVVLSHALGLDHEMWLPLIGLLAPTRPIYAYDHAGHGRSSSSAGYDIGHFVNDAVKIIDQINEGPVVWIGLSMGAMVGQGLAIKRPELLSELVLAHTVAVFSEEAKKGWGDRIGLVASAGMSGVVDAIANRYLTEYFQNRTPRALTALKDKIVSNDPQNYAACCAAVAQVNWIDQLVLVKTPTLVIAGELDLGATPAMAAAIHQRIAASQLVVLPKVSHLSPWEDGAAFSNAVNTFLI